MIFKVNGYQIVSFVSVYLLGCPEGSPVQVQVISEKPEIVTRGQVMRALCQKIQGVRIFPNDELDLYVEFALHSGSWCREKTLRIPEEHIQTVQEFFEGEGVELTKEKKNALLSFLVSKG